MAANYNPIYTRQGDVQWGPTAITTANTAKDGTGTVITVWTADATEGGFLKCIRAKSSGTAIATVLRLFINNGSTNTTANNNVLYAEQSLPAITNSETAAQIDIEIPMNIALPPGYKINACIGTTVAAGWYLCGVGGKY